MKKRARIPMRKSKRQFTKHAKTHVKNLPKLTRIPMRGGIRL